ncbi:hypothetical protein SAMN04488543_3020 [Friedmanniella luteola]|uniref:Uncharacterized protein n=1 Tax=Friedmanniella luteola TaxID=546871 RepID=A0A1H1XKC8_9ACTN|nr:hypothetical protein SAMN04488543_3020 [Friedmanniella luteola]
MAERSQEEDRAALAAVYSRADLRLSELWLAYFALGGNAGQYEVEAYLTGMTELGDHEHNVLAHALNEELDDRGSAERAPYR